MLYLHGMKGLKTISLIFICCVLQGNVLAQSGIPPPPTIRITEIMYNPPESGTDSLEYIEITTLSFGEPYNFNDHFFSSGIDFSFPDGVTSYDGQQVIIAKDSIAFENQFGIQAFQWNNSSLLNSGEGLTIRNDNWLVDTVYYSNSTPWPSNADGLGSSLIRCSYWESGTAPTHWQASENNTGIIVNGITIYADPGQVGLCTTVGVAELGESEEFRAYPNPSKGGFTLLFKELEDDAIFSIHDSKGSLIHYETVVQGLSALEKQMALAPGLYWLELETDETHQAQYLIISD